MEINPLSFPTPENLVQRLEARHDECADSTLNNHTSIYGEAADYIQYLEDRNEEIMTRWGHSQTVWVAQVKKLREKLNNRNIKEQS